MGAWGGLDASVVLQANRRSKSPKGKRETDLKQRSLLKKNTWSVKDFAVDPLSPVPLYFPYFLKVTARCNASEKRKG